MTIQRRTRGRRPAKRRLAARCTVLRCSRRPVFGGMGRCGTHALQAADAAFRDFIRERDHMECQVRDDHAHAGSIQVMHFLSRRYRATRWLAENAALGCAAVHKRFTEDPLGWEDWLIGRIGETDYRELRRIAREGAVPSYEEVITRFGRS